VTRSRAIVVAALLDGALGDPRRCHPVAALGKTAACLERVLWAPSRVRGVLYVGSVVAAAAAVGARTRGSALEALVLWAGLGGRSLGRAAAALADAIERGELEQARRLAPTLMGRDPAELSGAELCRGAVESVAENTADAVVGALVWHALLGPAGSAGYRAANTLDAMVGHRSVRYERFGWAAARLDDLATWPAARLAAALTVLLAGPRRREAWRVLHRDGRRHPSPNAGLLEAAFAGALAVRLGGAVRYQGRVEQRPQLGDGELPGPGDLRRAIALSRRVTAAAVILAALAARGR
jgi:adenosylcobinamide-phosphate synthase